MPPKKSVISALKMRKPPRSTPDPMAMEAFIASGSAAAAHAIVPDDAYRVAVVAVHALPDDAQDRAADYVCLAIDEALRLGIPHVSCDIGPLAPDSDSDTPAPRSAVVPAAPARPRRGAKARRSSPVVQPPPPDHPVAVAASEPDEPAVADEPRTASEWIERAHAHLEEGDIIRALLGYGQAIRLEPSLPHGWALRALVRERMGNLDGALADYDEALGLDPSLAEVYYNRANAYRAMYKLPEAMDDYDEAIRLDASNPLFFNNRGNARFAQLDLTAAEQDFDAAIALDPEYANAFHNRGNVRCQLGRVAEAIADFRRYLELGGGQRDGDQAEVEQLIAELEREQRAGT